MLSMIFPKEAAEKLRQLDKDLTQANAALQNDILNVLIDDAKVQSDRLDRDDIQLIRLFKKIYHYGYLTDEQKSQLISKLKRLRKALKELEDKGSENDPQHVMMGLILNEAHELIEHQANYLEYTPGAGKREYIRLLDIIRAPEHKLIVDKAVLELSGDRLIYDGKDLQGVKIDGLGAEITGQHFSSAEAVNKIYHNRALASERERYCYLAEPGKLEGRSEREIRKVMGAAHADANITVKIEVPAHLCWIRVKRGQPAKFAIESSNVNVQPPKKQRGFRIEFDGKVRWAA